MPIYEYECLKCGVRFERKQTIYEEPVKSCPQCQGKVRKLIFPVGIVFKGSGFYKTDYASKPIESGGSTESPGKSEPAKTESKPEASPAKK